MTVSVDMLFGKFIDPRDRRLYAIGNNQHFVLSNEFELLQQTICPLASQMQSDYSNAFPIIRNSATTGLILPYFAEKFSKQLFQIGSTVESTKILCSAPSCDFFCYCRHGPGHILAFDRQTKDWFIYNGLNFAKSTKNYFPEQVDVNMAEFCGKTVIFAQKAPLISVVIDDEVQIKECNRPSCNEWYVEAIWLNLVFLSCEGDNAPFYCIFDIIEEKVVAEAHENSPILHFPFIAEDGFFYKEHVNDMENILTTLFAYDYKANMEKVKLVLSDYNNGLADFEREIYARFGLIDATSDMHQNFGILVRGSKDIQEMIGRIYVDLSSKFAQEMDKLKLDFEKKIKVLNEEIQALKAK